MASDLIGRAARFAARAHSGQKRKYTGEPYFNHLIAVAMAVSEAGADEATVAAAYLHDTLEDTPTKYSDLVLEFGPEVADLVHELTDVYTHEAFPGKNRKARKELENVRLSKISAKAKAIKRADVADNAATIERYDPKFAKVWLAEKEALLAVL